MFMKNKILLTVLLATSVVVATTGCDKNPPSSTDPNVIEKAKGNGTDWIDGIQDMLGKVWTAAKTEPYEVPYVDTTYYSAQFTSESTDAGDEVSTTIVCENDESMSTETITAHMATYTSYLEENGFEIDKSLYQQYRIYAAVKKIKGAEYLRYEYGLTVVGTENEYDAIYGFILYVGYQRIISNEGWMGEYLEGWPSADIADALNTDVPHPSFVDDERDGVTYFGGFNLIPVTNQDGTKGLLECYVLWCIGTNETDLAEYLELLTSLYWEVGTFTNSTDKYAFNFLTQVVIETAVMSQTGFGTGICLFMYLNEPTAVFKKSAAWPNELATIPAYVEEGATLTYFSSSTATVYGPLYTVVVGGVGADAENVYTEILTAAGYTVTTETDTNNDTYKYAIKGSTEIMFYLSDEPYPDAGEAPLIIQAFL